MITLYKEKQFFPVTVCCDMIQYRQNENLTKKWCDGFFKNLTQEVKFVNSIAEYPVSILLLCFPGLLEKWIYIEKCQTFFSAYIKVKSERLDYLGHKYIFPTYCIVIVSSTFAV